MDGPFFDAVNCPWLMRGQLFGRVSGLPTGDLQAEFWGFAFLAKLQKRAHCGQLARRLAAVARDDSK
ncbi:hypothetical protein VC81_04785 [Levilactobacillus spicheri]|uniref:Uncharacterized protein n=1 Tax=Levilactobacillus spicheri TaxID=216463 RepID=A0A0F3RSR4_9LACO|nr:hypothetical protein VC81_04785 [Levilactobacillus spicheri]